MDFGERHRGYLRLVAGVLVCGFACVIFLSGCNGTIQTEPAKTSAASTKAATTGGAATTSATTGTAPSTSSTTESSASAPADTPAMTDSSSAATSAATTSAAEGASSTAASPTTPKKKSNQAPKLEDPLDYSNGEEYADNAYKYFEYMGSDDPWNDALDYWDNNAA